MLGKLSFDKTFKALENAINIAHRRHEIIWSNISNLDTSNRMAMDIDFKAAMARALESQREVTLTRTDPGHLEPKMGGTTQVEPFEDESEWNGFNGINIDREMTKLIENNLQYRTATEVLLRKIAVMKEVIRGVR